MQRRAAGMSRRLHVYVRRNMKAGSAQAVVWLAGSQGGTTNVPTHVRVADLTLQVPCPSCEHGDARLACHLECLPKAGGGTYAVRLPRGNAVLQAVTIGAYDRHTFKWTACSGYNARALKMVQATGTGARGLKAEAAPKRSVTSVPEAHSTAGPAKAKAGQRDSTLDEVGDGQPLASGPRRVQARKRCRLTDNHGAARRVDDQDQDRHQHQHQHQHQHDQPAGALQEYIQARPPGAKSTVWCRCDAFEDQHDEAQRDDEEAMTDEGGSSGVAPIGAPWNTSYVRLCKELSDGQGVSEHTVAWLKTQVDTESHCGVGQYRQQQVAAVLRAAGLDLMHFLGRRARAREARKQFAPALQRPIGCNGPRDHDGQMPPVVQDGRPSEGQPTPASSQPQAPLHPHGHALALSHVGRSDKAADAGASVGTAFPSANAVAGNETCHAAPLAKACMLTPQTTAATASSVSTDTCKVGTACASAHVDAATAPANMDSAATPAKVDEVAAPPKAADAAAPSIAGNAGVPTNVDGATAPANMDSAAAPAEVDNVAAPTIVDGATAPANMDSAAAAAKAADAAAPSKAGKAGVPTNVDGATAPANMDSAAAPANMGKAPAPANMGKAPAPINMGKAPALTKTGRLAAPAKTGKLATPAKKGKVGHAHASANLGYASAPGIVSNAAALAKVGIAAALAKMGRVGAPAKVNSAAAPAKARNATAPANVNRTVAPANVNNTAAPANVNNTAAPANVNSTAAPAKACKATAPAKVNSTAAPAKARKSAAPAEEDSEPRLAAATVAFDAVPVAKAAAPVAPLRAVGAARPRRHVSVVRPVRAPKLFGVVPVPDKPVLWLVDPEQVTHVGGAHSLDSGNDAGVHSLESGNDAGAHARMLDKDSAEKPLHTQTREGGTLPQAALDTAAALSLEVTPDGDEAGKRAVKATGTDAVGREAFASERRPDPHDAALAAIARGIHVLERHMAGTVTLLQRLVAQSRPRRRLGRIGSDSTSDSDSDSETLSE